MRQCGMDIYLVASVAVVSFSVSDPLALDVCSSSSSLVELPSVSASEVSNSLFDFFFFFFDFFTGYREIVFSGSFSVKNFTVVVW